MKRFIKSFRYGEKGFTLIELLIVVAILGILAAVVLPNVGGFLRTSNLAAANSEVAAVKTAAAAFYAENNGDWPETSEFLGDYLDRATGETYTFDPSDGHITTTTTDGKWGTQDLTFNVLTQLWEKL